MTDYYFDIFLKIVTALFFVLLYFMIRSEIIENTIKGYEDAVYSYQVHCIVHGVVPEVGFADIISFNTAFWKIFQFRTIEYIPKDKYKIIKEFLK